MGRFMVLVVILVAIGIVDGSSTTMTQPPGSTSASSNKVTGEQEQGEGVRYLLANIEHVLVIAGENGGFFVVDYPQLGHNTTTTVAPNNVYQIFMDPLVRVTVGVETKSFVVHVFGKGISFSGYSYYILLTPLPISALGSRYVVSTCLGYTDHVVLVIANYNQKTEVDITLMLEGNVTYDNMTYNDGDMIHVSLDEYQTFTLKSTYDLTGTVINSTRAVAVFSGATQGGDVVAVAQLLAVRHHGSEFVLPTYDHPLLSDPTYHLQIVSDQIDTEVMLNNGSTFSLGDGRVYRQRLVYNEALYFNTTKPVMATLCRTSVDIYKHGFVVVTPVEYFITNTQAYFANCINVLTQKHVADIQVFKSDITPVTLDWVDIPGSDYKVGAFCLNSGYFVNSTNRFALFGFNQDIFHGGFHFPADPPTTPAEGSPRHELHVGKWF